MMLVEETGESTISVMEVLSPVASVDTCYIVMNFSMCFFTRLSQYEICFVSFRCLEFSSLQNFPMW